MKMPLLALLALALLSPNAFATADKDTEALLAKMRKAYSSIRTASLTVSTNQVPVQPITSPMMRHHAPLQNFAQRNPSPVRQFKSVVSKVLFSAPFRVAVNCSANGFPVLRCLCDGRQIATIAKEGSVNRQGAALQVFDLQIPALNLESMCFFDWKRQLSTDKGMNMAASTFRIFKAVPWNGKQWTVLEETAQAQNIIVLYYIDPITSLIWRTVTSDIGHSESNQDCQVVDLKVNPKLSDEAFKIPSSQFVRLVSDK